HPHATASLAFALTRSFVNPIDRTAQPPLARGPKHFSNARLTARRSRITEIVMKVSDLLVLSSLALIAPPVAWAQVAGSTLVGVSASETRDVALGWSAKRKVLGAPVFNDQKQRTGKVDDIIIAPDKAVSYAIINAGGFLKLAKHDVAIPVSQLK